MLSMILTGCGGGPGGQQVVSEESTTTTSIPPLTQAQVEAALPSAIELPFGWSFKGEVTKKADADVDQRNFCGKQGEGATAALFNQVGSASTGWLGVPGGGDIGVNEAGAAEILVRAFTSPADAAHFMDATSGNATSCADGYSYEDEEINNTVKMSWRFTDGIRLGSAPIAGSDTSFMVTSTRSGTATDPIGRKYTRDILEYRIFARTSDVVVVLRLGGITGASGYKNPPITYAPQPETALAAAVAIYPSVLRDIGQRP